MKFGLNFLTSLSVILSYSQGMKTEAYDNLIVHNLRLFNQYALLESCSVARTGCELFKHMKDLIRDICCDSESIEESECVSEFIAFNFIISGICKSKDNFDIERKKAVLYQFFDQQRSLVPPMIFEDYDNAFIRNELDKCYSLLNVAYGELTKEEMAYIKAYKYRDTLRTTEHSSGILFVDLVNVKMYFMKVENCLKSRLNENNVLLVPNGIFNLYKFYSYTMYLIDKIVETSQYCKLIQGYKNHILYEQPVDCENKTIGEIEVLATTPSIRILAYKFLTYCILSMEISGLSPKEIKESADIIVSELFDTYESCLVVKNDSNIVSYLLEIVLNNKKE